MRGSAQGLGDQRVREGARPEGVRGLGGAGWLRTEGLAGQRAWWPRVQGCRGGIWGSALETGGLAWAESRSPGNCSPQCRPRCALPSTIVKSGLRSVAPDAFHFTPRLSRL